MEIAVPILQLVSELFPLALRALTSNSETHAEIMQEANESWAFFQQEIGALKASIKRDDAAAQKLIDDVETKPGFK